MRALLTVVILLLLSAPAAVAAQGHQVPIDRYAYRPGELTVRVGETVTWTNQDQAPHDVVTTAGPAVLRSPLLAQGQSWSFTFTLPGAYDYYCSVHPDMRARVTVLPEETTPEHTTPEETTRPHVVEQPPVATPPADTAAPTATTTAPLPVASAAPPPSNGLDPMLLLAGLVAAVTTFCLLLVGSRPEKG